MSLDSDINRQRRTQTARDSIDATRSDAHAMHFSKSRSTQSLPAICRMNISVCIQLAFSPLPFCPLPSGFCRVSAKTRVASVLLNSVRMRTLRRSPRLARRSCLVSRRSGTGAGVANRNQRHPRRPHQRHSQMSICRRGCGSASSIAADSRDSRAPASPTTVRISTG